MNLKGVNPGRLNRRVIIMRYQETEDSLGNTVYKIAPLKKVWAEIRPIRGKEQLEYYKDTNSVSYKITIRSTDVTEKDVLKYKDRQFQINYILNPLEASYYLELFCTESKDHAVGEVDNG
ncbi:SPP1 family predicted phage head-tail adaptor [Moryella indoligenes]|uniref:SPP1 family predicted phage head-tail adaptor n=1 Tax=Moryella indoligenes TaxID=371674 RepID=A0AAE4AME1_9FIRM|nr:phage head closure protein [Moryella indoligenes]MDQ0153537.1 SPP1 family predicted phage head-tail adaptor [Moryella indoligenes]